jgi:hypothetical protein
MSYNVSINGQTNDTTSFDAAKVLIKTSANDFAVKLAQPVHSGLYRSPKTVSRVNADRLRSAQKLSAGIKLPKKAEDVSGRVGGLAFSITRK